MTDPTTAAPDDGRLGRFDDALAQIGHRSSGNDRRNATVGLVLMGVGIVAALVSYFSSTSMSDQRDVLSAGILALLGLTIAVVGAAVFVRYSLTEFLRFWMLRLLLEQADESTTSKNH